MSLLQDVLKQQLDALAEAQRRSANNNKEEMPMSMGSAAERLLESDAGAAGGGGSSGSGSGMALLTPPESDEDDPIDVTSGMATPVPRSRAITRSSSPTRQGYAYQAHPSSPLSRSGRRGDGDVTPREYTEGSEDARRRRQQDPLRSLPDKIRLAVFCFLDIVDLASCSLVCQRWKKSQTINHAFYQLYRTEAYVGSDLPVGRWTKRESKRDWRSELLKARRIRYKEKQQQQQGISTPPIVAYSRPRTPAAHRDGGASSPHGTGHLTPRELQEEEWAREQETSPTKNEMRSYYKEHGGKRIRKSKAGMTGGMRDRTAWGGED